MLIGVYKSPNQNKGLFLNGLESHLNSIHKLYNAVICGDIKIDILNTSLLMTEYLNIMTINEFVTCINKCNIRVFNDSKSYIY